MTSFFTYHGIVTDNIVNFLNMLDVIALGCTCHEIRRAISRHYRRAMGLCNALEKSGTRFLLLEKNSKRHVIITIVYSEEGYLLEFMESEIGRAIKKTYNLEFVGLPWKYRPREVQIYCVELYHTETQSIPATITITPKGKIIVSKETGQPFYKTYIRFRYNRQRLLLC